ncbi:MAG: hypothetical protein V7640_2407 [Betaproteobacteria bacterium]|jgi:hypothetical protein
MRPIEIGYAIFDRPFDVLRYFLPSLPIAVLAHAGGAIAGDDPVFRLQMSPYALHYQHSPDHRYVWAVGVEMERKSAVHGIVFFKNSFGQNALYVYPWGGMYENLFNNEHVFFKWSIGVLYGYKPPYQDKVPFNFHGYSPAIVPAIGWNFSSGFSTQLNFLGASGVMLQISKDL